MSMLKIGDRLVGGKHPTYFIADIAANHDGDLARAKELIHLAAEAGADCAKFQNFKAEKIVSDYGFKNLGGQKSHQSRWKKSVFDIYRDASLPESWNETLAEECRKAGVDYSTSPYDFSALDQAAELAPFIKIGSGDITWLEMLRSAASKDKPIILACGASTMEEVERAAATILPLNKRLALLQCNTNYEGGENNFSHLNLSVLQTFQKRWPDIVVGLSDHTPGNVAALGAVALGGRIVEKHFTDDTTREGPDHAFSMTPSAWRTMVKHVRLLETALGNGEKRVEENERDTVVLQRRCLRAAHDLPVGHLLTENDIEALRPAPTGAYTPDRMEEVVGRRLAKAMLFGEDIRPECIVKIDEKK